MTALASTAARATAVSTQRYLRSQSGPVAASTILPAGGLVSFDPANSNFIPTTAATSGYSTQVVYGVAADRYDNSAGVSGAVTCVVMAGEVELVLSGITAADRGLPCYAVDNQTVSKDSDSGKRPFVGHIVRVDGTVVVVSIAPEENRVHQVLESISIPKIADAAAGTTSEEVLVRVPYACTLTDLTITPAAALTANDTNYATITFTRYNSVGGAGAVIAAFTTKITGGSGNWSQRVLFQPATYSGGALANTTLAAGSIIAITVAKAASGVAIPQMLIEFDTVRT